MQVTLPPSPVWWELERWRRGGARAGAPRDEPGKEQGVERGAERGAERGVETADGAAAQRTLSEKLAQFRLLELQRLRDLHAFIERQRLTIPDILQLYTPSRLGQGEGAGARPTSTWRQRPLSATWHHIDFNPHRQVEPNRGPERVWGDSAGAGAGVGVGAGAGVGVGAGGWGAAGGWAVGVLLLVAALVLVRLADRCLARKYLRSRRRRSQEWPAPNVLATSLSFDKGQKIVGGPPAPYQDNLDNVVSVFINNVIDPENPFACSDAVRISLLQFACLLLEQHKMEYLIYSTLYCIRLPERPNAVDLAAQPHILDAFHSDSSESGAEAFAADPPPPYSECSPGAGKPREEPPPPYSADYVAYAPKDQPAVRFYSGSRQVFLADEAASHSNDHTARSEIAHSLNRFNHIDTGQALDDISVEITDDADAEPRYVSGATGDAIAVRLAPIASEIMSIDSSDDNATVTSDTPNN